FSSRRRHTRSKRDWSSDVCSSDLLLELHYPVDDLVLQAKDDEGTNFASNAVGELRRRMKVRAVVALKPQKIFLVVHRLDFSVYFRRIEREEYSMLKALHGGDRSLAP